MKIYYQTTGYTCGPASSIMILEHFGLVKNADINLELDISKGSNLFEGNPASGFPGLAINIMGRGLKAELHHESYNSIIGRFILGSSSYWKVREIIKRYSQQETKACEKGLLVKYKNPILEDIVSDLKKDRKIISRISFEEIPHLVVINSFTETNFEIYCPIEGIYNCPREEFMSKMNFITGRSYLSLWK